MQNKQSEAIVQLAGVVFTEWTSSFSDETLSFQVLLAHLKSKIFLEVYSMPSLNLVLKGGCMDANTIWPPHKKTDLKMVP